MKSMRAFVFVTLLQVVTIKADDVAELMAMLHSTCTAETGVSDQLIADARGGKFADDGNLKCYMKCYLAQVGCIDEDTGDIDNDALTSMMPEDLQAKIGPLLTKCGTVKGADVCDTAFQTHKCWQQGNPQLYASLLN